MQARGAWWKPLHLVLFKQSLPFDQQAPWLFTTSLITGLTEKKTCSAKCDAWPFLRYPTLSLILFDVLFQTAAHMLMLSIVCPRSHMSWSAMAELRLYVGRSLSVGHFIQKQTTVDKYCSWTRIIRRALPRHVTSHVLATKTSRINVLT